MSILYEERLDGALPDVDRTSVLMALREHVPGLEILHTDEEIIPYECDGLSAYRTRPLLVVLPKQMEQVTAILAVCHRLVYVTPLATWLNRIRKNTVLF